MRAATISILGLYNWDNTLFDFLALPEEFDRADLVNNLLAELAEMETLYPNPVIMKNLIGVWSRKQLPVWQHLYDTTHYEYNPIENYNRYENGSSQGNTAGTDSDRTTYGGTDTTTASGTDEHYTAGFDPGTPTADDDGLFKQHRDEGSNTSELAYGRTENRNGNRNENRNENYQNHMHGNIGVMSTQDMIKQEREIAMFNVYDIIIDEFKQRFCLMVY